MRIISKFILLVIITFLFRGCAIQVPPTGGVRDIEGPKILSMQPNTAATGFAQDIIEIEFDEYVKLNAIRDKFLASPPLKYDPIFSVKGKRVIIEIKDTLIPNTTYLFNFGDAIVDIRENNPLNNFQYVFSTGDGIDSLEIRGSIKDAFSREPAEEMTVGLYRQLKEDSIPYKYKPVFIAKTNEYGEFNLQYLSQGSYSLFALKDENSNYLFDRQDEQIAFLPSKIDLQTNIDAINLDAFIENHESQYLKKQEEKGPYTRFIFNLPIDSLWYNLIEGSINDELLLIKINSRKDTIDLWWREQDGKRWEIAYKADSLMDTIKVKVDSIKRSIDKSYLKAQIGSQLDFFSKLKLSFPYPISSIDTSLISIYNKDSIEIDFEATILSNPLDVELSFNVEESSNYKIEILPNAFEDIYETKNDSIQKKVNSNQLSDFGNLTVIVETSENSSKILQLLNTSDKVIREMNLTDSLANFTYLKSGIYKLRLIYDSNNDGVWTTGNYLEGIQAERIVLFDEKITMRSNWDKEIKWVLIE
jgi:uncharacterized protein (DUF2141 family)